MLNVLNEISCRVHHADQREISSMTNNHQNGAAEQKERLIKKKTVRRKSTMNNSLAKSIRAYQLIAQVLRTAFWGWGEKKPPPIWPLTCMAARKKVGALQHLQLMAFESARNVIFAALSSDRNQSLRCHGTDRGVAL